LIAGEHTYLWKVRHHHNRDMNAEPPVTDCKEIVAIRREGCAGHVRIFFREGPGHVVGGGYLHSGGVVRGSDDTYLNLNRPAVAGALLDEALSRGWNPAEDAELDGWELVDAVRACMEDAAADPG
jgi:hypothetical protein